MMGKQFNKAIFVSAASFMLGALMVPTAARAQDGWFDPGSFEQSDPSFRQPKSVTPDPLKDPCYGPVGDRWECAKILASKFWDGLFNPPKLSNCPVWDSQRIAAEKKATPPPKKK
jgi:hypothetical protein